MSTSRSLNKVILIGNLTRDPQVRYTPKGSVVCTFGLATNSNWKNASGEQKEHAEFHYIVAWNKLGEISAQLLSTGMLVYVEGEIRTRTWESQGQKRSRVEIKISDMKVMDNKGKSGVGIENAKMNGNTNTQSDDQNADVASGQASSDEEDTKVNDEDLPF